MLWTNQLQKVGQNAGKARIQKQFLIILLLIAVCFVGYGYWKLGTPLNTFLIGLSTIALAGIVLFNVPRLLKPLLYVWLSLGMVLGEITSIVILGIIYYLLFFPITFILRITRKKDAVQRPSWHSRKEDVIDYKKLY